MSHKTSWLSALCFEAAYFSAIPRLIERSIGGAGIILKFERVRPARSDAFQPLKAHEITPQFLNKIIRALKRWPFDIVDMDEACRRAAAPRGAAPRGAAPRGGRRFVALTFDGGTRDFVEYAYPLLAAHEVPFTLYLPTAFADGLGAIWWLALEQVIATHDRISLIIDDQQRHFEIKSMADKYRAHHYLDGWLRTLAPHALAVATDDLCRRYSVDIAALSRRAAISWDDVAGFASHSRVVIGSSTVNYPSLTALDDVTALREISMGRAVAQSALPREVRHFAFPFGDSGSFDARHLAMVAKAGFTSAVTSVPGVMRAGGGSDMLALPRVAWDGRRTSLHALRVMLSGVMLGTGARR